MGAGQGRRVEQVSSGTGELAACGDFLLFFINIGRAGNACMKKRPRIAGISVETGGKEAVELQTNIEKASLRRIVGPAGSLA